MARMAVGRLQKEVSMLQTDPPPGAWASPVDGNLFRLEARLQGPSDSVYEGGVFTLVIDIPSRWALEAVSWITGHLKALY